MLGKSRIISPKKDCEFYLVGKQPKNYFKSQVAHILVGVLDIVHLMCVDFLKFHPLDETGN